MTQPAPPARPRSRQREAIVDCDIHNTLADNKLLYPYLPARWRRHLESFGIKFYYQGAYYPRIFQNAARSDAWPPGRIPGSDLDFLRAQLLDEWQIDYGILNALYLAGEQPGLDYAAALATALNEWLREHWLEPEPRLRGAIIVPYEEGDMAAAEIERQAADRRFVQVLLPVRTREPLGRRKYWPMYAAAERHGLPIGIHFGGANGWPITGAGWPSFYFEDHCGMPQSFQAQVISLIFEGVFEQFPSLKVVLIEGGFGWLPSLMWRMDRIWGQSRDELEHVTRPPSEALREHFWFTTQPVEEPPRPEQFSQLLRQIDMDDHILFSTDYPHWDFDSPDLALPSSLPRELRRKVMSRNALSLYGLP